MKFTHLLLLVLGLSFTVCKAQNAADIEKQKSKLKLVEEEKLTGEFATLHKKYEGKVVFSNSEINRDSSEKNFITTYTFGEKLSIRAFLPHSILNSMLLQMVDNGAKAKELNNNGTWFPKYLIVLYLDGNRISNTSYVISFSENETHTDLSQRATLNDDESEPNIGKMLYKELKNKLELLTPGKHKLKIEYQPYFNFGTGTNLIFKPVAQGEIEMIIKDKKIDLNDPDVCLPIAQMNDKLLEGKILKAFKSKGFKAEPKKVRIVSKKWTIIRNEYGIILRRYVEAYIGYTKGGKCYYDTYNFNQDYDGSAYEDEVYLMGEGIGTERERSCECLK
jgi:hypothetical protein